ncbi:MAG: DUF2225 domain-containing protein [Lachnospiraceae bacterium]|nr:DUF2225 domain-containing protein [Lachnospiraceae bacterium]
MSNLLSGLGKFGLGNLEEMKLFEEEEKKEAPGKTVNKVPEEEEFLFDKSFDCVVCDAKFTERVLRANKARLLGVDTDLRPRHEHIDVSKYDVISCPYCGYTALSRYYVKLPPTLVKLIKANISDAYIRRDDNPSVYSYDYAFERYQLCLANAIVRRAKDSEKAYICLKISWILRGMGENLDQSDAEYKEKLKEIKEQERGFSKHAYDGFSKARQSEDFPLCRMDEATLDYLLAVLAISFNQPDVASRLISGILTSHSAKSSLKEKARDLKDKLKEVKGK